MRGKCHGQDDGEAQCERRADRDEADEQRAADRPKQESDKRKGAP